MSVGVVTEKVWSPVYYSSQQLTSGGGGGKKVRRRPRAPYGSRAALVVGGRGDGNSPIFTIWKQYRNGKNDEDVNLSLKGMNVHSVVISVICVRERRAFSPLLEWCRVWPSEDSAVDYTDARLRPLQLLTRHRPRIRSRLMKVMTHPQLASFNFTLFWTIANERTRLISSKRAPIMPFSVGVWQTRLWPVLRPDRVDRECRFVS